MNTPTWWGFVLLALASYRTTRLLGWDTITERPRELLVRKAKHAAGKYRQEVDVFLHCPWCLGFWVSLGWWGAFEMWQKETVAVATLFAISAFVGTWVKYLDT